MQWMTIFIRKSLFHQPNDGQEMIRSEWDCLEQTEDDWVIERFEVRVRGKKPLVLVAPKYEKLVFVTQQYLSISLPQAKEFLREAVLNSPDPFTFDEHVRLLKALERDLEDGR